MDQIPIEVAEEVESEVPDIVDAVQTRTKGPIVLMLDDFGGQERLFFNTVWFATSHGKRVVIEQEH